MNVVCLGVSHQSASVEIRERFAVPESDLACAFATLGGLPGIAETVIVSTCNRVEFYAATDSLANATASLRGFVETRSGPIPDGPFYLLEGHRAVNHLFRVVSGLESMVIGETEILGQVKKAYAAAVSANATARTLNKFFQRAFNVAKEVRTQTSITRGPVSVGSVTVDLAEKIFGKLSACHAMILGAGETSELAARSLLSRGVKSIFVSNRTYDRAAQLAAELGGEAIHFDQWGERFHDIDILISSTAATHLIVTQAKLAPVMQRRPERPLFVIDLAVPRDVEPAVNQLENVYLYDIDSLQAIARQGIELRRREVTLCEELIKSHVFEFGQWLEGAHQHPMAPRPKTEIIQVENNPSAGISHCS